MICSRVLSVAAVAPVIRMYHTAAWGPRASYNPAAKRPPLRPFGSPPRRAGRIIGPAVRSIDIIFPNGVCGVLRTENADAGFQACLAAIEGGVGTIEITTTVPTCFEMVRGILATTGGKTPLGVGTVWDPGAVRDAKDAGADSGVRPFRRPELAEAAARGAFLG